MNIDRLPYALILLSIVCSTLITSGCSKEISAEQPPEEPMQPAVNVVGFMVAVKDISDTIALVGTLEANESVEIKSEINGIMEEINVEEGQRVREGDVLFRIEKRKLQAAYDQAVANLKLAESTAQRYEKLVQSKAVSDQEYDQTRATLASSYAMVQLAREDLEDAVITAPFDGVIGERLISTGQYITQGMLLSYLFSKDPMKVGFRVPERYIGEIGIDQQVTLTVAAFKDKAYEGRVFFIDPRIDETTRTALVKAYVPNSNEELRQGMFANLDLIVNRNENALVVPESALIIQGDTVSVYVIRDSDTVDLRPVTVGERFSGMVEIREGVNAGDVVVTEGYQKIGPGSRVQVRFEDPDQKKSYEII